MARKVFELKIDPNSDAIVDCISMVESPAIESNFIAFSKSKELFKQDDEKMEILGPALIPDMLIPRSDKNMGNYDVFFSKDTVRKISQIFIKNGFQNNMNLDHNSAIPANSTVVQSYIVDLEKDVNAPKGIDAPDGSWIVGVQVHDKKVWDAVKSGAVKGFSIEGVFQYFEKFGKVQMSELEKDIKSLEDGFEYLEQLNEDTNEVLVVAKNSEVSNRLKAFEMALTKINDKAMNLFSSKKVKDAVRSLGFAVSQEMGQVYSYDEIILSDKKIGSKIEKKADDGSLQPVEDGTYEMEDGIVITAKDGLIESITDKDGNPLESEPKNVEAASTDAPADNSGDTVSKEEFDALVARVDAIEKLIQDATGAEPTATAEEVQSLKKQNEELMSSIKKDKEELMSTIKNLTDVILATPVEKSKTNPSNFKKEMDEVNERKRNELANFLVNRKS